MADMKLAGWLIGISCAVGIVSADSKVFAQPANQAAQQPESQWSTIQLYCFGCHNEGVRAGNLFLDQLGAESVPEHPEIFEKVVRKLRGRQMPPPGMLQPSQQEVDALIGWLESTLDESSKAHLAGRVPVQRLNRTEYANAVKDLLAVEVDPNKYLPADIAVEGFNNIAAALTVSPAFLEQYLNAARVVARLEVGKPTADLVKASFPPPAIGDQDRYVDGMPLGTRGGTRFEYTFPADGEYRITITNLDFGLYPRGIENETAVVVLVDRKEVFRQTIGGDADRAFVDRGGGAPAGAKLMQRFANIPVQVTAGVHEVVVTFIERSRVATDDLIAGGTQYSGFAFKGYLRLPRVVGSIQVVGPYAATGPTRTPSREKLFVCKPEVPAQERACAERITQDLAGRAFRRPVTKEDIHGLMAFYDAGREGPPGGFNAGIEQMVTAVLVSPDFLYRGIAPTQQDTRFHPLTDLELASRLSFFLWKRAPDAELLDLASKGELRRPGV